MFLLAEKLREGKLKFSPQTRHAIRGIQRVRKLPNGRIDMLSIDESTRLTANTMADMDERMMEFLQRQEMEEGKRPQ